MALVAPHDDDDDDDAFDAADAVEDTTAAAERQGPATVPHPGPTPQPELGSTHSAPLNPQRERELQGRLDRWYAQSDHGVRTGPFHGVALREADLSWLAARVRTATGSVPELQLAGADLGGMQLAGMTLREAHLEGTNLGGANLARADLRGAHLEHASL